MADTSYRAHGIIVTLVIGLLVGLVLLAFEYRFFIPNVSPAGEMEITSDAAASEHRPGPADDRATEPVPVAPARNAVSSAGDFVISLPPGWEVATGQAAVQEKNEQDGSSTIVFAAWETEPAGAFRANLVVVKEEGDNREITSTLEEAATELAAKNGGEYWLLDPVNVDGVLAHGYSLIRDVSNQEIRQSQRFMQREGNTYVVTFSILESDATMGEDVLRAIMGGWNWRT